MTHLLFFMLSTALAVQTPTVADGQLPGTWTRQITEDGTAVTELLLFTGGFFSWTRYETEDGAFLSTKGGSWSGKGDMLRLNYEFSTKDAELVGQQENLRVNLEGGALTLVLPEGTPATFEKQHAGESTALTGAWLFSGRKNDDGEISRRDTDQPRKTMKILTGDKFQWIAYNTETGQFFGTGGGSYTAEDGKYTENIEFFSRDNSRVGAELQFNFDVQGDDWHHSGFSSKGDPMYEVWSRRD